MDASKPSLLKRGRAVLATAEAELEKANSRPPPIYRFHLPPGAETDIIILDASFDEAVGLYEHHIQEANGRWGNYVSCLRENCSFCQIHGESYYVIFVTILNLREYVKKSGEAVPFLKMLLQIKLSLLPRFLEISSAAMKKAGTLRGTCVTVKRDSLFQTTWQFSKVLDEKMLKKNYGSENTSPFDYDKAFKRWVK